MKQTVKGTTRAYRKACKAAGMLPDTEANRKSDKKKFPIKGAFHLTRGGKVVPPSEVDLPDTIVDGPAPE